MISVLDYSYELLPDARRIAFEDLATDVGRVEIYEHPQPGHLYALGSDHALGLQGKDYDTFVVLDVTVRPVREVAEAHVHLGQQFDRLLYAACVYYNEGFLCGERQFGLPVLRSVLELGHTWLYYERDEDARSRPLTDTLGYWRGTADICIPNLRRALKNRELVIRSRTLLEQLSRLQFTPRRKGQDPDSALDADLVMKLKGGGSPDLVMALAYAWNAARNMPRFERPERRYPERSLGTILQHHILDETETETPRRRRKRR